MVNLELLVQQFTDAGIVNVFPDSEGGLSWNELATPQEIAQAEAIVLAHNPNQLSREQILAAAQVIANQAKLYFLSQLDLVGAPNLTTIFSAVQTTINSNPVMQQRHTRTLAFIAGARGWSLPLNTGNDQGKQRYLEAAFSLIGMMG